MRMAQCSASTTDPMKCQWLEGTAQSTPESSLTPNQAPPPVINGVCGAAQCSDGIAMNANTAKILFNNNYNATGSSTTCRFVDNTNPSDDIFVPQNSSEEFTQFVMNAPNYMSGLVFASTR